LLKIISNFSFNYPDVEDVDQAEQVVPVILLVTQLVGHLVMVDLQVSKSSKLIRIYQSFLS